MMKLNLSRAALFAMTILVFGSAAQAKVFRNSYVSFELPEKWDCVLEQTEWVCRPTALDQAPKAVIILTAKEVGPTDTLASYQAHLRLPRTTLSRGGQPVQSQVYKVDQTNIANHPWVDAMHLASEIPNYYTRYLATTKDRIGILVTFSAHKLHYTQFNNDFFRAIQSLRVVATRSLIRDPNNPSGGAGEMIGSSGGGLMFEGEDLPEEGSGSDSGSGSQMVTSILGLALILGAVGIFLLVRRSKKKR